MAICTAIFCGEQLFAGVVVGQFATHAAEGRTAPVWRAGGISHTGDLELIIDVVREFAGTVDWVFFGMCQTNCGRILPSFMMACP